MAKRKRTPEEEARRTKIRELLQASNVCSMEDIQNLFKETIAEFMETGLDAELDEELGYSTTIGTKRRITAATDTVRKRCEPVSEM